MSGMLHQAITQNNWVEFNKLLQIAYINPNERDKTLQTPLHVLCSLGNNQLVEALINKSADVNANDSNNWVPLHCAASNCHLELVELLLNHPKINVSAISKDGTSIFHYLMRNLVPENKEEKYVEILNKAKSKGANIQLHGKHLETPLHQAAIRSNLPAIKFLISNSVNINAQNKFGETALHYAARNGDANVCQLLMYHSADLSISSRDGTPVEMAANPDIKNLLLKGPTKPTGNLRRSSGTNPTSPNTQVRNIGQFQPKLPASPPVTQLRSIPNEPIEIVRYVQPTQNQPYPPMMNYVIDHQFQYQLQVQQQMMLSQYMSQAYSTGTVPTCLPLFCTNCIRPFTYPVKAITIKCPFCLLVHPTPTASVAPLQ